MGKNTDLGEPRARASAKELAAMLGVNPNTLVFWKREHGLQFNRKIGYDIVELLTKLTDREPKARNAHLVQKASEIFHMCKLDGVFDAMDFLGVEYNKIRTYDDDKLPPMPEKLTGEAREILEKQGPRMFYSDNYSEPTATNAPKGATAKKGVKSYEGEEDEDLPNVDGVEAGLEAALNRVREAEIFTYALWQKALRNQSKSSATFAHKAYTDSLDLLRKTEVEFQKYQIMKKQVLPVDVFREWLAPMLSEVKQTILSMPPQVAPILVGRDVDEIQIELRREFAKLCNRIREPDFATDEDVEDGVEASIDGSSVEVGGD